MLRTTRILVTTIVASLLFGGCIKDIKPKAGIECSYVFNEAILTNNGWTKVLDENFDGDLSNWNIWYGGAYNDEKQLYQASNLVLEGGVLKIISKRETLTGPATPGGPSKLFKFTSGRIETKAEYSAGTATPNVSMVARIHIPYGRGMWPAFWTCGPYWPSHGEIDIMENHGWYPSLYTTNYFYGATPGQIPSTDYHSDIKTPYGLTSCFHVYQVTWTQNKLTYYLDGEVINEKTGHDIPNLFNKMHHVIVNLAVGGTYTNQPADNDIQTGTMLVDYVKIYTK